MPLPSEVNYQYMAPIVITSQGILTLINKLKLSSSSGIDGINSKILKNTVNISSTILAYIFEQSLLTGEIPND